MQENQIEVVGKLRRLKRIILFLLKETEEFRMIIFIIIAVLMVMGVFRSKAAREGITTTHPVYLPPNVQLVKDFSAKATRIDCVFDQYQKIAKNSETSFMSIKPEKQGLVLMVNYYLKDQKSEMIFHASEAIWSPGDNGLFCYVPRSWSVRDSQLIVERDYDSYRDAEVLFLFLASIVMLSLTFYLLNVSLSIWFRQIARKMESATN